MSIQFLGMIGHRLSSETIAPVGPIFDRDYIVRFAQTHEAAGFDRLLVGHWSDQPDGFLVTALAGLSTQKIQYLLAHRPGFVSPTLAARKFATLEHLLGGRLAVHIISGGNDAEQRRDGDYLDHDQRYARTDAFLDTVRQVWTSEQPVDIHNDFYQAEQAWSAIRPLQKPHLPIYFGGSSEAAIAVAGKHADVFALWGESLAQTGETIQRVRAEAAKHQRDIGFSVSFRPIIADSEAEAWEKAEHILHVATEQAAQRGGGFKAKPDSIGAQRLRATAAQGRVVDKRLWTGIAQLVGGGHNSTALVGTPEQVASLDASGEFPWRNIDHLRAGGWLSLAVPPSCGGAGASLAQLQQVIAAIAWGEPATALIVCMQYLHHLRMAENDAWHAPLRQQVFHDAVEHGGLINSLRVEPELGSPARGGLPDTVATRRAEGWDISGHKIYTTGIEGLRWLAVWARSDDNPPLVGTWLVPGDSPGITVVKSWDHAGMRATGSHEVIFNHVRVAAEHAVDVWPADAPPAAQAEPFRLFANRQTALLAAIYDSIAHAAHDWLVRWLAGRVPAGLGHPLSRLPRVQEKVGQIAGLLLVNRSLLEQAAALRFSAIEANLAKVTITDNAIQAVNIALELTGNHGLSRQNPLERHYRNVLCGRVHTPQSDSAWLAAGNFVFQSQG